MKRLLAILFVLMAGAPHVALSQTARESLDPAKIFQSQELTSGLQKVVDDATLPFQILAGALLVIGVGIRMRNARGDGHEQANSVAVPLLLLVCIAAYPLFLEKGRGLGDEVADATGSSPQAFMDEIKRLGTAMTLAEPKTPVNPNDIEGANKAGYFNFVEKASNNAAAVMRSMLTVIVLGVSWGLCWILNMLGTGIIMLVGWALTLTQVLAPLALGAFAVPALAGIGRGFFVQVGGLCLAKAFMAIALIPVRAIFHSLIGALGKLIGLSDLSNFIINGGTLSADPKVGLSLVTGPMGAILLLPIIVLVVFALGLIAVVIGPWYGFRFLSTGETMAGQLPQAATAEAMDAAGNAIQEGGRSYMLGGGAGGGQSERASLGSGSGVQAALPGASGGTLESGGGGGGGSAAGGGAGGSAASAARQPAGSHVGRALSAIRASRAAGGSVTEARAAGIQAFRDAGYPEEQASAMGQVLAEGDAEAEAESTPAAAGGGSSVSGASGAFAAAGAVGPGSGGPGAPGASSGAPSSSGPAGQSAAGASAGGTAGRGSRRRRGIAALAGAFGETLTVLGSGAVSGELNSAVGLTGRSAEAGMNMVRELRQQRAAQDSAEAGREAVEIDRQMLASLLRAEENNRRGSSVGA